MAMTATRHSTALTAAYRERKPDKRTELADAYDEITALRAELVEAGQRQEAYARTLDRAFWSKNTEPAWRHRWDLVADIADRLRHSSKRLTAQGSN